MVSLRAYFGIQNLRSQTLYPAITIILLYSKSSRMGSSLHPTIRSPTLANDAQRSMVCLGPRQCLPISSFISFKNSHIMILHQQWCRCQTRFRILRYLASSVLVPSSPMTSAEMIRVKILQKYLNTHYPKCTFENLQCSIRDISCTIPQIGHASTHS